MSYTYDEAARDLLLKIANSLIDRGVQIESTFFKTKEIKLVSNFIRCLDILERRDLIK